MRWREIDEQNSLGEIRIALTYAAESGAIDRRHVDTFAHIVLAATNEVALMIARAGDPGTALGAGESAVAEFLDRLLGTRGQWLSDFRQRLRVAGVRDRVRRVVRRRGGRGRRGRHRIRLGRNRGGDRGCGDRIRRRDRWDGLCIGHEIRIPADPGLNRS
ncbi:hypothetical protein [Nocardia sp.]|uniref:hypothetical protein n=1 Tax=Nocardia sp. TaxID=1821 RepID=UPI00260D88F9|nr:hypothetical protein [Nocardia sp.]